MVEFSQEELRRLTESEKCHCQSIYKGNGFTVYVKNKIDKELINIFVFENGQYNTKERKYREDLKFAAEASAEKNRFIDFNGYVISLPNKPGEQETVNFADARLYKKQGALIGNVSQSVKAIGSVCCNKIVVIDRKLLIICNHYATKVLCVIEQELRCIPMSMAEQLLRLLDLGSNTLASLITTYPEENWTLQNGLILNAQTLSVPSSLQYYFYKERKRSRQIRTIKANMDFVKLARMLNRNEKDTATIKYINSKYI